MDKAVRLMLVLLLAGLFGLSVSGCTRRFYRNRADLEVARLGSDRRLSRGVCELARCESLHCVAEQLIARSRDRGRSVSPSERG